MDFESQRAIKKHTLYSDHLRLIIQTIDKLVYLAALKWLKNLTQKTQTETKKNVK
jgi:hypothetical protein